MQMMTYEDTVALIANKEQYKFLQLEDMNGQRLCAVLVHEGGATVKKMMSCVDEGLRCQTCKSRIKRLCRYSNGHTPLLFSPSTRILADNLSRDLREMNATIFRTRTIGLRILIGDVVDQYEEHQGPWSHYYVQIPETQRTTAASETVELYNRAIRRYVPEILPRMLSLIGADTPSTADEMLASLNRMVACLEKATYGRMLEPSVRWLIRVVSHFRNGHIPKNQWMVECARILLWTNISPDGNHNAVSPVIQQATKNVIPIMMDARDEKAMVNMLTDRLSPAKYQRPTTIKPQNVQNAIQTLGDFTNTIMTWKEASMLPDTIVFQSKDTSSMQSFQHMLSSTANKKKPYGFASRSKPIITTITQLIQFCETNKTARIEICTSNSTTCYLATTTLQQDLLSVPHLWSFLNNTAPASIGMQTWEDVCGIARMFFAPHKNLVFLLRDTTKIKTAGLSNCCFPAFISAQHRRTCGDAFERLNQTMKLKIPSGKHIAIGIGVSIKDTAGTLHKPATIRIDGIQYVIARL